MEESSYITIPAGFKANGVAAGMKCSDRANINPDTPKNAYLDVGLIVSDTPCNVAGVYTSNLVKGHSLVRSINIIESGRKVRGIIVNSKNANAAVGSIGIEDADKIAASVAKELGCTADEILTASTGVIGTRLPLDLITDAVPGLVSGLSASEESAHNSEYAMMTTDTVPKEVSAEITLAEDKTVRIAGQAKGSGMIHPNLATMIGIFTTDADIEPALLKSMLKDAVKYTFNRVSVDGDTSVCDMVTVLANGKSGVKIESDTEDAAVFAEALRSLCEDISRMLASDGEGATKFVEVEVYGAKTEKDAYLIASAVAKSPLCKTAFFGMDANCGRILTAAGYSGADFDPEHIDIKLSGLLVYKDGVAADFDEAEADRLLHEHDIKVELFLNEGDCCDRMFTCDFSYKYVEINGSYRT